MNNDLAPKSLQDHIIAIENIYWQLGEALARFEFFIKNQKNHAPVNNANKEPTIKALVKEIIEKSPDQPVNLYQVSGLTAGAISADQAGRAMISLCKDGVLTKIGLGTYILKRG